MSEKHKVSVGYLPIIDHLVLGISNVRDKHSFKHINLEPVKFHSWPELANALEKGEVDSAFIMAPYAMHLKNEGASIKTLLLGHREGLGFVVNKKLKSLKELEGETLAIPHKFSTHHVLLHEYLVKNNIDWNKIKVKEVAPPDFVSELTKNNIFGYFGSEPFGAEAEYEHVGKVQIMSKDIKHHHIDCILVVREEFLKHKESVQELVDSLVNSGKFMQENTLQASKIGAKFLEQPRAVIQEVLHESKKRVSSWDLLPLKEEFEEMQNYMTDMNLTKQKIDMNKFLDVSFANNSYESLMINQGKKERIKDLKEKIVLPIAVIIGVVLIWQLIASLGIFSKSMLPSPLEVGQGTIELAKNGILFKHIVTSLYRVFIGFILAAFFGIPIGLLLGAYQKSRYAFDPLIQIIRPISPIAWIPLAILWLGVGDKPAIFIIFITAFFPIMLAANSAVRNIDPILIKAARNFGTDGKKMLKKVILPASFPYIMVGVRISLGISWVIIVAAEMVGMESGLGFMILDARNFLRTDLIITGMIIIGLIGFILDRILSYLESIIKRRWGYVEAIA